ncbi:GNAT family N-acetyltransferase [Altererythrobacter xixiisoli]|uniref:GNAT family N-acetyltransferase n=1 Tax=Croceibacterium xixiisoli TaxID=1476466 RepID=A0A6I4TUQ1_9SPHN|nr:GNAT family N-acetyltransferase [Croceibacterium xixiisoli]MXO99674.1 GNAT family N-acetyltransferase [Croceibacterium xixiisoli]
MFIRTDRLFLRPAWAEDAAELNHAIAHRSVVRMMPFGCWPLGDKDVRAIIDAPRHPFLPHLLITLPDAGGAIIGGCGLFDNQDQPEVGYWITPEHAGQGYATEALKGLLDLARMTGHRRLFAHHAADDPASARILRKAGFRPTGRCRTTVETPCEASRLTPEYMHDLAGDGGPQDNPVSRAA